MPQLNAVNLFHAGRSLKSYLAGLGGPPTPVEKTLDEFLDALSAWLDDDRLNRSVQLEADPPERETT